ncbi:MAG: LapA family protein [Thermocrispum sp.]
MSTSPHDPRLDPPTGPIATPGAVPPEHQSGPPATGPGAIPPPTGTQPKQPDRPDRPDRPEPITRRSRLSSTWVAVVVAVVVLIFLLVFILQNLDSATVHFLGASGTLPLGVAMLFAAIAGALLVALIGSARILQLRRRATRERTPTK